MDARNELPRRADPAVVRQPLASTPACCVCGRRDETLRVVVYPFVFSLLFVTFRRAFTGLWCSRDRLPWAILAGLITATVGWLGIPFGLVFTPLVLHQLALGGELPEEPNVRLLSALGEEKLRVGDVTGATRCLEACLRVQRSPAMRDRLRQVYASHRSFPQPTGRNSVWPILLALPAAGLVGLAMGGLDYAVEAGLGEFLGETGSILALILSWTPLVALAFTGALLVRGLVEWALARARCRHTAVAAAVGLSAAALAVYGLPGGRSLGEFVEIQRLGVAPVTTAEGLRIAGAILTRGAVFQVLRSIEAGGAANAIFLALLVGCAYYIAAAAFAAALQTAHWQQHIAAVAEEAGGPPLAGPGPGLAALGATLLGLVLLAGLFPQQGTVDYLDAMVHARRGMELCQEERFDAGTVELQHATRLQPGWALGHLLLGTARQRQGEIDGAIDAYGQAIRLNPAFAEAHLALGGAHLQRRGYQEAVGPLQEAIRLSPDLFEAHVQLAVAYFWQGEFAAAVEPLETSAGLQPDSGVPHAVLAMVYTELGQRESMEREMQEALARQGDIATFKMLGRAYILQRRFAEAEGQFVKAIEVEPSAATFLELADAYARQGKYGPALEMCDKAQAEQDNPAAVRVARADVLIYQEQLDRAVSELTQALELSPQNPEAHDLLAFVYLLQGRFDLAQQEAQEALKLDACSAGAHACLALACQAQGQIDRALAAAQEAARLLPTYDTPHYALGLCYAGQGEEELAAAKFRRFLELYWERPWIRQYKARAEAYLKELQ